MSSILKALKKLEEQKAARPRYEVDLSSGITRERRTERRRPWAVPAGMCAVAVLAALATYATMSVKRPPVADKPLPAAVAPAPAPTPSLPAPPVAQSAPSPVALPTAPEAGFFERPRNSSVSSDDGTRPVSQKTARTGVGPLPARHQGEKPTPAVIAPQESKMPDKPVQQRLPDIKLTGIAWQKDSASRYAVLNGVALSEGATIEGARIDEILPDRVRFSQGGRTFDILLDSQRRNN